jgi:hypothetical protein
MNPKYNIRINEITRLGSFNDVNDVINRVEVFVHTYVEENPSICATNVFVVEFSEDDYNFDNFVPYSDVDPNLIISWIIDKYNVSSFEEIPAVVDTLGQLQEVFSIRQNKISEMVNWDVVLDGPIANDKIAISTGTLEEV